ncbi:hypothetical protein CFIO01_05623 [Colletotrichum fioriniae PJ7]|uniref:T cell CD4 receptor C-terminal region domain-containing protein n=1 Tax=Colletotrichum fioriniae PJ7 TaxID=1445577 RepID=A0A010R5X9_9PEZI|nr:hypothetical protein CFIO01_05623 [Colletotrichum fioriniae PJ7]
MSSNITKSIFATTTEKLAITTPFVQPPDCLNKWTMTEMPHLPLTSISSGEVYHTVMSKVSVSAPPSSCYPFGWDRVERTSRLNFSPGVCPEDWTYYSMARTHTEGPTSAYCCNRFVCTIFLITPSAACRVYDLTADQKWSGFNYTWVNGRACAAWGPRTEALPNPDDAKSDQVLMIHTPWTVTWDVSDTATLTPKLPTLASLMIVPTWTTGQTIPDGVYDYEPPRLEKGPDLTKDSLFMFLVVGCPVILFVLVCSCVFCCVRSCRKKRRQEKAAIVAATNDAPTSPPK